MAGKNAPKPGSDSADTIPAAEQSKPEEAELRGKLDDLKTETETAQATQAALSDLQQTVETTLTPEEREKLLKDEVVDFIEGLLGDWLKVGKESTFSSYLTGIATWIAGKIAKFGFGKEQLTDEEVYGQIDKEREKALEAGFVAHRGGWEKPNSKEGIKEALEKGEGEVEFDVRLINGELYLRHDPMEGSEGLGAMTRLSDVLPLFQNHPNARMFVDVKGGRETAEKVIEEIQAADARVSTHPLAKRTTFVSFNPEVLKVAREKLENASLLFAYFPTGKFQIMEASLNASVAAGAVSKEQLINIMKTADSLSGGTTNHAVNLKNSSICINGQFVGEKCEEELHTYSTLPPDEILEMVRASNGALAVPWGLVRTYPKFFEEAKAAGIKVAVFGFQNPRGDEGLIAYHNDETKRAIAMGANLIITDHADIIS